MAGRCISMRPILPACACMPHTSSELSLWAVNVKAHHFFAVGLSKLAHLEYDADHDGFEVAHQVTHAKLIRDQWVPWKSLPANG